MVLGAEFDDILEAAQSGAGWACSRIYQWLAASVAGYFRVKGADEPDDLASEVFLRVFSGFGSFSGDEAQFRAWVFTIAHSRLVDGRRQRDRTPQVGTLEEECPDGDGPTTAGAEEMVMERLAVDEVDQLLAGLTCEQRDVLALRLIGELSVHEVARVLDKPPGAIKALQRRALASLRRRLRSGGVGR